MNLAQAITKLANDYQLDEKELLAYVAEDTIGGHHEVKALSKWPVGSMWEVEAQVIYALIRAVKPNHVLEFGRNAGCSTTHIVAALHKNGSGRLTSVDIGDKIKLSSKYRVIVNQVEADLYAYKWPSRPKVDFVVEDLLHTVRSCSHVWGAFADYASKGAWIVSHDSEHYIVGNRVKEGIEQVTSDYTSYLIEPGKCGLAVWRKS